ncbi:MAG: TauD/TfdA family dioxygenase, partial [Alphaproteobacteria bacterium]|nr:TauD/TfdA family dioxygenase [Alphaproteobacteria bacterium]
PSFWQVSGGAEASLGDVCDWLVDHREAIEEVLDRDGALHIRGLTALNSAAAFEAALDVLAPRLMDYVGGTSPRHAVHGQIVTATDLPENYTIPMHQEMSYTADPPDRVAFFCETPAGKGGATTVADAREITRRIDPAVRARFEEKGGMRLRRTLPGPNSVGDRPGVPKPWTEVFVTEDEAEVERVAAARDWEISWLEDGSVQLWQEILPAMKTHPRTGETVWFNQAHIFAPEASLRWSSRDGRREQWRRLSWAYAENPELVDHVFHGNGEQVSAEHAEHLFDVFVDAEVRVRWKAGDLLLLDNVLAVHGRTAFEGERRVLAALIRDRALPDKQPVNRSETERVEA